MDDCRVEGELHDMEIADLEARIRELELENTRLREMISGTFSVDEGAIFHNGAYFLKAAIMDGSRPKIIFRSQRSPDVEISIEDNGNLVFRRAVIESVDAAAMLAGDDAENH